MNTKNVIKPSVFYAFTIIDIGHRYNRKIDNLACRIAEPESES